MDRTNDNSFTRRSFLKGSMLSVLGATTVQGVPRAEGDINKPKSNKYAEVNKMVVISDTHLGEVDSILHSTHKGNPNPKIKELVERLNTKAKDADELILLGDIMDFSLASVHEAYADAKLFFQAISNDLKIPKVTYVPGNHDHHIWMHILENEKIIGQVSNGILPPDMNTYINDLVTYEPHEKHLLKPLLHNKEFEVTYPYLKRKCKGKDKEEYYYLTHGHYLDDAFTVGHLVVDVKAKSLAELEAFNCWWLEGGWFYLGQAGRLSQEVENIYKVNSWKSFLEITKLAARAFWRRITGEAGPAWVGTLESDKEEFEMMAYKDKYAEDYIEKYVEMPSDHFYFVFGHTHEMRDGKGAKDKKPVGGKNVTLINTGAWLAKEKEDEKNAGFFVIDASGPNWVSFI